MQEFDFFLILPIQFILENKWILLIGETDFEFEVILYQIKEKYFKSRFTTKITLQHKIKFKNIGKE